MKKGNNAGDFVTRAEFEKLLETVVLLRKCVSHLQDRKIKELEAAGREWEAGEKRRATVLRLVRKSP